MVLENDGNVFFSYWGKPLFENVLNVLWIVFFSYWGFVFFFRTGVRFLFVLGLEPTTPPRHYGAAL